MRIRRSFQAFLWVFVYLALTCAPVLVMFFTDRPAGREFWRDFSVALGFCGLAMMALQFVLTARFKTIKSPYGSDIVYFFHKRISIISFLLILAHPVLLFVFSPDLLRLLNPFDPTTPWRARFAVTSLLALFGLIGLSIWRKKLRLEYTRWRIGHGILAVAAVVLAAAHMYGVGYYVNTPAKQVFWFVYLFLWVWLLLWVRIIKPFLLLRKPFEVVNLEAERGNAWSVTVRPKGHAGFRFQPGQFAWLTAWSSPFADTEHPFSISSSSERAPELVFTIKNLGDFTARIKELQVGQEVYVDGPYGSFSIDRHTHAEGFVFLAGGIGITPMMSMLQSMADRGDRRPALLIYANNNWDTITFREKLEALKEKLDLTVVHVLRNPPQGWQGESGYVTKEVLERYLPNTRTRNTYEMFICGPQPMMDMMEKLLTELGVYVGDFHSEQFNFV